MSFTQSRFREQGTSLFPEVTAYVSIQLDPVKSLEILEDDEATVAAQNAVNKVYVGYIAMVCVSKYAFSRRERLNHS